MFVKPLSVGDEKNLSVRWKKKLFFQSILKKKWMIKKFNLQKCDAVIAISWWNFLCLFCKNFGFERKKNQSLRWKEINFDLRIAGFNCRWSPCSDVMKKKEMTTVLRISKWFVSVSGRHVVIKWSKTLFWVKVSQNHMSESKCRRGLNLNPMVKVTVKPCRLMLF